MATVTVLSHLPHAIEAQLYKMELWPESTTEKRAIRDGLPVTIYGTQTLGAELFNGSAVTHDVDWDFYRAWREQNANVPWATMIFAVDDDGNRI